MASDGKDVSAFVPWLQSHWAYLEMMLSMQMLYNCRKKEIASMNPFEAYQSGVGSFNELVEGLIENFDSGNPDEFLEYKKDVE